MTYIIHDTVIFTLHFSSLTLMFAIFFSLYTYHDVIDIGVFLCSLPCFRLGYFASGARRNDSLKPDCVLAFGNLLRIRHLYSRH